MYREFLIKDEANRETKFQVYPNLATPNKDLIKSVKEEIEMTLRAKAHLSALIKTANEFMSDNTISEVEIKEVEE